MDILCFSSSDWEGNWGSRQQVMLRFAGRGCRVVFVEQLAGLEHFWRYPDLRRRRWSVRGDTRRKIRSNLWLCTPPPLLPGRYYWSGVARLNAVFIGRWIKQHLKSLGVARPVLWLYKPEHAPLVPRVEHRLVVYHCIDEFTAGQRGLKRKNIAALERQLLERADVVFANSALTFKNKKEFNPNTHRIPSGADVEQFSHAGDSAMLVHPDIAALPKPILVCLGNINEKIDTGILMDIAANRPHWTLVLIGQEYPQSTNLSRLKGFSNIYCLGKRPQETLPSLMAGADVCILPYVQSEAALYRSPLKLYDFLATGKPIVSTEHPEVGEFSQAVTIAPSGGFIEAVEAVLKNDRPEDHEPRMSLAREHSWDARVDAMQEILEERLPQDQ